MMRSLVLVIATVLLIVCGFAIYATMQSPVAPRPPERMAQGPGTAPTTTGGDTGDGVVGPGRDPWVRRFDEKTAELESRFKAARYERQDDGTVLVDQPVAEFFLGDGRFVRIEGSRGSVILPESKVVEGGEVQPPVAAPPSRGQLHDVVISLFDEPATGGAGGTGGRNGGVEPEPMLTVSMNNTAFDNDTFLITTEAFTDPATGQRIEADQVPVQVRGRDYDFDGRGLRIQWNELSQRLQLLEIAHGESLRVKNPARFDDLQDDEKQGAATPAPAKSGPGGKPKPAPAAPATTPAAEPIVPYRASFEDDLRIIEADTQIALGSLMQVDFVLDKRDDEADDAPAATPDGSTGAGRAIGLHSGAAAAPSTSPAATQPPQAPPITVYWTGRLRVMPLEHSDEPAMGPDDQIIRLAGSPLQLYRDGAQIEAAGATFHTADGRASLRSSDEVPRVTLRDASGAVIATPSIVYSEDGGTAILKGPSRAELPIGAGDETETLLATWNDQCRLVIPTDQRGEASIRHAHLSGAVAIAHPRMKLNSDALDLTFAAPATQPATRPATQPAGDGGPSTRPSNTPTLEKLVATGSVLAEIHDPSGPPQSLQAGRLEMLTTATSGGDLQPRTIVAEGDVLLSDPTQSLRADRLHTTLRPKPTSAPTTASAATTAPATTSPIAASAPTTDRATTRSAGDEVELVVESLIAQGAVRLQGQDGAYATAEELQAVERDGRSELTLTGGPGGAAVSDGRSTITGPVLKLRPAEEKAEVPGAGTLTFFPASKDGQTPQPIHAAWTGHAALDGATNRVDLHDGVTFKTTGDDGTTTTSHADHLQIVLADKPPATQPSTQPTTRPAITPQPVGDATVQGSPTTAPTTQPRGAGDGGLADLQNMDFLAGKEPRLATLSGDVRIESTLLNDVGGVLRRMYLSAGEARYDLTTRRMTVPGAGRLLYEDHRPPDAQPKGQADPANRGTTAFAWTDALTYDDDAQRAVMEGAVEISHVPDADGGEQFRIATQRVTADLEPRPETTTTAPTTTVPTTAVASTAPASTQEGPLPESMRLRRVTAEGGVRVQTDRFEFTADRLSYSPTTGILTAHGGADDPIRLTEDGRIDSTIDSLTWNTKTDQVTLKGGRGRVRP